MKNKDNEAYGIDEIIKYDEMYYSKDEIYNFNDEIYKNQERAIYDANMNDLALEAKLNKNNKLAKVLVITTGTLAIIMAIFFLGMKRFNQNLISDVLIEKNVNSITINFKFENEYKIECYYGLVDSNNNIIKKDTLKDSKDIVVSYDDLELGNYKFVVYENFYGYNLYYYESDLIIIE